MPSPTLPSGCGICGKKDDLLRCAGCKVVPYCGRDHQAAHRPAHKSVCSAIRRSRVRMEQEEAPLHNCPGDFMMPAGDAFVHSVGFFWDLPDTRDYMRARLALVQAFDHLMDILRLGRSDSMGVRDLLPPLILRLNRDQECYDFVKWWDAIWEGSHYDWGNGDLPYLDIKSADMFESVDGFGDNSPELDHIVCLILLKIKLLLDLNRLDQSTAALGSRVPREILDEIQSSVPQSPIVAAHRDIVNGDTRHVEVEKLTAQVETLFRKIDKKNRYFWAALMHPMEHLNISPDDYQEGSKAWVETPGAIDFIKAKMGV
ncbi:hypothetical protein BO71DRAFT_453502 [Aspergillus ellipticus CBS 707.79]|uniref:MYND-type domain-containing protein n=1 Tax=Aspergillus ellipticus CBS 707.79 TaxID=1448320 RepID=A0A319CWV3_9EURO|nr:hypothetical protein BO71DRAFT_453502 [Aspergillus ellipticus CBS 707.79]